jgi:hypothetical protein
MNKGAKKSEIKKKLNGEEKIVKNLKEVKGPESSKPIYAPYHLTVPFCPDTFPFRIRRKLRRKTKRGVKNKNSKS